MSRPRQITKTTFLASGLALLAFLTAPSLQAQTDDAALVRNATGPALICDGPRKLYGYSKQLPEGSPISPGRDVVAFVRDGKDAVLRVTINRENSSEFLVDRLPIAIVTSGSTQRVVAMDSSDLIGQVQLYAIAFDRSEVATGWGVAGFETQSGGGWYVCRKSAPAEILP